MKQREAPPVATYSSSSSSSSSQHRRHTHTDTLTTITILLKLARASFPSLPDIINKLNTRSPPTNLLSLPFPPALATHLLNSLSPSLASYSSAGEARSLEQQQLSEQSSQVSSSLGRYTTAHCGRAPAKRRHEGRNVHCHRQPSSDWSETKRFQFPSRPPTSEHPPPLCENW